MLTLVVLVLLWAFCSVPFIMMGIPDEAALVLGAITGICVIAFLASKSNGESSQKTVHRPVHRSTSSYSVSDDEIDEMIKLDMMDGKLDSKFDFFDKD